ncbi:MAG TPA: ABC transporter permease [Tepidisphaeraceae bacterium]|jgi:ABC-type dipeptide/oligopeptide/nickel transport system permease component
MIKTLFFRILQFPLILAVIYVVTFLLCWVAPGSPFENPAGKKLDPIAMQALKERFHADSTWKFLSYYPTRIVLHGDFGPSLQQREWSVNDILKSSLPISVTLGIFALTIASIFGVAMGAYSAVRVGGLADWFGLTLTLIGISLPSFVSAAVLLIIFSGELKWFPVGGWGGFTNMVLPALALSLAPMAYIVRLMRASMLDVLGEDYVRTARAKGLSRPMVIIKHCLRNAFLPILSFLGPAAANTLTGSFVVEKVFNIPGLGEQFVNSVLNRDQTLILGTVIVYSALLLFFNLLVDVSYTFVDPRIVMGAKS